MAYPNKKMIGSAERHQEADRLVQRGARNNKAKWIEERREVKDRTLTSRP